MLNIRKPNNLSTPPHDGKEIVYALKRAEFKAYYQPKVELSSLELSGLEVLARWQHPCSSLLTPDKFLPSVKAAGLLNDLTHSLLYQALTTHNSLMRAAINAPMALNLETSQIGDGDFICSLIAQANIHGFRTKPLTIEITESGIEPFTSPHMIRNIAKLNACGWRLSLDDFGTGHSSLERLCQIPCSEIKIDQSFTQHMLSDMRYQKIVKYIIAIGKAMQLTVVAEGIETFQQLNFLQSLGCDQGQGYIFSPALSAEDIQQWCFRWNRAALL